MRDPERSRYDRHLRLAEKITGARREELAEKFQARVLVTGAPERLQMEEGRLTALTGVNLIARFCSRMDMDFGNLQTLQEEAVDLARRIDHDPKAEYRSVDAPAWGDYRAVLYIGRPTHSAQNATSIVGRGWLAAVSSSGPAPHLPETGYNPFGPILAASFGAAEVFKRLLQARPDKVAMFGASVFSAYSYQVWGQHDTLDPGPPLPANIELPPIFLAGAGAVGNAFAYAVREVQGVRGSVSVVDKEDLGDDTNLNRYSLAFHDDSYGPLPASKVNLIDRAFAGTGIGCAPFKETIQRYLQRLFDGEVTRPTVVISAVDNNEIRPSLQRLWPDLLIEGATSDALFQVSRHAHAEGMACLMCIHTIDRPPQSDREYEDATAERTGLSGAVVRAALRDPELVVTQADADRAPEEKRASLQARIGEPICSVLTEVAKLSQTPNEVPRAATVSFVSMAAGALAAAETVKWAARIGSSLETIFQMDLFVPLEKAILQPVEKSKRCECFIRRETIERYRTMTGSAQLRSQRLEE